MKTRLLLCAAAVLALSGPAAIAQKKPAQSNSRVFMWSS